jgi:hypothetical protein
MTPVICFFLCMFYVLFDMFHISKAILLQEIVGTNEYVCMYVCIRACFSMNYRVLFFNSLSCPTPLKNCIN